jgi:hypothetical protein
LISHAFLEDETFVRLNILFLPDSMISIKDEIVHSIRKLSTLLENSNINYSKPMGFYLDSPINLIQPLINHYISIFYNIKSSEDMPFPFQKIASSLESSTNIRNDDFKSIVGYSFALFLG